MALILADRVRETTTSTGTGSVSLAGALTGFQTFSAAIGNGNTTYYVIAGQGTSEWEVGIGTYTSAGNTLSRDTVLSSSNAGALVNFSAGTKDTWSDYAAGKAVTIDTLAYPPAIGGTTPAAGTFTTLTATGQTSLGGVAGSESFRAVNVVNANRYVLATAGVSGSTSTSIGTGGGSGSFNIYANGGSGVTFTTNGIGTNEQFRVAHTASAVNYVQATGAATTKGTVVSSQGSDANISSIFQSKGTGAIDLAAGSSGVNISNGGTVTAITGTSSSGSYTSIPSVAITAPTTAGGVQATATAQMAISTVAVNGGGTGYTVNDLLTLVGGTFSSAGQVTVTSVSAGVITGVSFAAGGTYSILPTNPVSVTGGTGTGATINVTSWQVRNTGYTITNAGSGYVEQPTVSFSGGGGSGAAAYASVGGGSVLKFLSTSANNIQTPSGNALQFQDGGNATPNALVIKNGSSPQLFPSLNNTDLYLSSAGTGVVRFYTNSIANQQMVVAHTASAVNYVQVTGAATGSGNYTTISSQGSDAAVNLRFSVKGTGTLDAQVNSATRWKINSDGSVDSGISASGGVSFRASATASQVNYLQSAGGIAGASPILSTQGTDTNIDLTLTPKAAGVVKTSGTGIQLVGSTSGYVGLKGAAAAGSTTYTLPAADGTVGQALVTNGSATLSWATAGATPAGSNTQVQYNSSGAFAGSANLTFDGTNLTCGGTVTANSDETLKTNWRNLPADFVEQLAKVKHGTYDRTDLELTQDGVSAQSLQPLLPSSVVEGADGKLSVAYGNAALVAAIALAERVVKLEALVDKLMNQKGNV